MKVFPLLSSIVLLCYSVNAAKKKRVKDSAADNFFHGVTPAGSTKWVQESKHTITTYVDTRHLKFDRAPQYMCTIVVDSRKVLFPEGSNYTLGTSPAAIALINVTGHYTPVKTSSSGFSVRLRYTPSAEKNITSYVATSGGWRVRWIALTDGHPVFESARKEIENPKYDGVDVKPVSSSLAYIKGLDLLINEDASVVSAMLGGDYEITKSRRLQAAKALKEKQKAAKAAAEAAKLKEEKEKEEKERKKEEKKKETSDTETPETETPPLEESTL